jgi:septal ring factor EnvC (AmiA/AmiB activator)
MDDALIARLFNATTGVWTLVVVAISSALVAYIRSRPSLFEQDNERVRDAATADSERRRDAAAEKANDFQRLREEVDRLSKRVEVLEDKVEECEKDRDDWRNRAVTAEAELIRLQAYEYGTGEARQAAQRIVSTERTEDGKKP